jgi:hypothetical protein
MNRQHSVKVLALASIVTLALGSVACSGGSSPTEPADFDAPVLSTSTSAGSAVTAESKGRGRGGDDTAGDDNGGDNNRNKGKGRGRGGRNGGGNGGGNNGGGNGGGTRPAGQEFEGSVASVNQNSVTLTNGTRIIVNGQTQWIARGDLHSLSQVARSVDAGRPTRVEGRGTRQGNGNFVATTIKAEVDN